MSKKMLFKPDETYTDLASELYDEASALAVRLLDKYKDSPTRDVETIIHDAVDFQAVFARMDRQFQATKKKKRSRKKRVKSRRGG